MKKLIIIIILLSFLFCKPQEPELIKQDAISTLSIREHCSTGYCIKNDTMYAVFKGEIILKMTKDTFIINKNL